MVWGLLFLACSIASAVPAPVPPLVALFPTLRHVLGESPEVPLALEESALSCAAHAVVASLSSAPPMRLKVEDDELHLALLVAAARAGLPRLFRDAGGETLEARRLSGDGVVLESSSVNETFACEDRRVELAVVLALWIAAGVALGLLWRPTDVLSAMPLFALIASALGPFVVRYVLSHLPAAFMTSHSPALRAPLVVALLLFKALVPGALLLLSLSKVAPHFVEDCSSPPLLPRILAAVGVGCGIDAIATHLFVFGLVGLHPTAPAGAVALTYALWRFGSRASAKSLLAAALALNACYVNANASVALLVIVSGLMALEPRGKGAAVAAEPRHDGAADEAIDDAAHNARNQSVPRSFAEFSALIQELPMVGERLVTVTSTYEKCFAPGIGFKCLVLKGSRGMGKTRLISELSKKVESFVGNCGEGDACLPFAPFREAIGSLIGYNRFDTSPGAKLSVLTDLVDSTPLSFMFGLVTSASGSSQQGRLAETIAKTLFAHAQQKRVSLVLEDVQSIDGESLEVLKQLIVLCRKARAEVTLTLTLRIDNASVAEPSYLHQIDPDLVVLLEPLTEKDLRQCLDNVGFGPRFVGLTCKPLFLNSKGSPLALCLMLGAIPEEALTFAGGAIDFAPGFSLARITLPEELSAAVAHKIKMLSKKELALVRFAAQLGLTFDFEIVSLALETDETTVALILHRLEEVHGIVCEVEEGVFSFSSGAFAEHLRLPPLSEAQRSLCRTLALAVSKAIASRPATFELLFLRANLALLGGSKFQKSAVVFAEEACEAAMQMWLLSAGMLSGFHFLWFTYLQSYHVRRGDDASGVAKQLYSACRGQGVPQSQSVCRLRRRTGRDFGGRSVAAHQRGGGAVLRANVAVPRVRSQRQPARSALLGRTRGRRGWLGGAS
jgi:hypothetical protein